jgi:nucleoside-diphosphate-sugar epimerase
MSNILITGASGFIGRSLVNYLDSHGQASVSFVRGTGKRNLLDRESLRQYFTAHNFTTVVHLASRVRNIKTKRDVKNEKEMAVNVLSLLDTGARFIYLSTADVYQQSDFLLEESSTLAPVNIYAQAKMQTEKSLMSEASKRGIDLILLRPSLVYGPDSPPGMFLSDLYESVKNSTVFSYSPKLITRDFINILDLCSAIFKIITHPEKLCGIYNLSTGIGTSLESMVNLVHKDIKRGLVIERSSFSKKSANPYLVLSSDKLQNSIDWKPLISPVIGLRGMFL